MPKKTKKPVVVLDKHRGIYFGYLVSTLENGNAVKLKGARHCFYYTRVKSHEGTYGLASYGPGEGSKVGPVVTMLVRDVAKIVDCTPIAEENWNRAIWGE